MSLHSLWTNSWCSSDFNKTRPNSKIQKKNSLQSHYQRHYEGFQQEPFQYDWTLECPLQQVDKLKDKSRKAGEISETKFITPKTTGNNMDDMVFQYNNQNSIYVLNADHTSYEQNLPRIGVINSLDQRLQSEPKKHRKTSSIQKIEESARSLQNKLNTFEREHFDGITPDAIVNPITSLMSSATCSPAGAVIQKLINCSSTVDNAINVSSNANSSKSRFIQREGYCSLEKEKDYAEAFEAVSINSSRNSNLSCSPRTNSKLSTVMIGNCGNGKKKYNSIKPTLIAKKTKFWKILEEEKARELEQDSSNGNLIVPNNCNECMSTTCQTYCRMPEQMPYNMDAHHGIRSQSRENPTAPSTKTNEPQHQQQQRGQQQQNKVNNWSGNHDNSNNQLKQQQKSSYELYREAAELLGLSCTLCDNCRCLDCQSGYFDCDDSDSYSDISTMDDYEYDFEEPLPVTAREMALIMHASAENKSVTNKLSTLATPSTHCEQTSKATADITRANYDVESGEATNDMPDMSACCCRNGNCRMEPHTNELDDASDSGFNNMRVYAQTTCQEEFGKISSLDSMTLEITKSSGVLNTTMNSGIREELQQHCHQYPSHDGTKHQEQPLKNNEVENCANLGTLHMLKTKDTENANSSELQYSFKD